MRPLTLCAALLLLVWSVGCGNETATPYPPTAATESAAPASIDGTSHHYALDEMHSAPAPREVATPVHAPGPAAAAEETIRAPSDPKPETFREPSPSPSSRARQSQIQSGTLTAGSIDDHAGYADFQNYLSLVLQRDAGRRLNQFALGRRIEIRVENDQGQGIGEARVRLYPAGTQAFDRQQPIYETVTHSDGRVVLHTALDLPNAGPELVLAVSKGEDKPPTTSTVRLDDELWSALIHDTTRTLPHALDLALVIDTTGSMGDELEYLKVEIDSIAAAVHERFPNVDQRFALILYRDEGDEYVARTFDFTGSLDEFRDHLAAQSANGGGDYPEAMHFALEQAGQLSWREGNAARVLFLVADAPPHDRHFTRTFTAVQQLRMDNVTLYPVAASGARDDAEFMLRLSAFVTQGQYLFLTDHSGVGNPHATPHTPKFSVERLDQLMVRMIASELAGRKLLPGDIIATEAGDSAPPAVAEQPEGQEQVSVVPPRSAPLFEERCGVHFSRPSRAHIWRWPAIAVAGMILLVAERLRRA